MGTHRRYKHHAHRQALVTTAAAGGLFVSAVPTVENTFAAEQSAASVTAADAEDETRRRIDQSHRFDSDGLKRSDQVRTSRGRHARPQLATTTATPKAKATPKGKATTRAKATPKKAPAASKQGRVSRLPIHGGSRISSTFAGHAGRMKGAVGGGIDYAIPTGTPVYATHAGEVLAAGQSGSGYGTWVSISYGRGYQAIYAHLSRTGVRRGDVVRAGDLLGRSGSTGRATGPHLHYELRHNGASVDPRKVDLSRLSRM